MSASTLFEQEVDRIVQQPVLSARDAYSIYSLTALLELPLMAGTEASLRQLLRHCTDLRAGGSMQREADVALLDVLQVVAGAYFGQDQALRLQFRKQGVHV